MRDPEYDRFGPWVIEITDEDPPPPLFLPYLTRSEEPLFSVKIPRKIERRNAHPGMNLYDYMVTLYHEDIVILERTDEEVQEHRIAYETIQFLCLREVLLKGTLQIGLPDRLFDLPFNTTSKETMRRLMGMVRQRYTAVEPVLPVAVAAPAGNGELSYYFDRIQAEQQTADPKYRLLASQADLAVASFESGPLRRLLYGAASKTLLESLHYCDGRELKQISRGRTFKYRWQNMYGTATYTTPLTNIQGTRWETDDTNMAVIHLLVETSAGEISHGFINDNPTLGSLRQFLVSIAP